MGTETEVESQLSDEPCEARTSAFRKKWKQSMIQTSTVNVSTAEYSLNSGEGYQEIGCCKQRSLPNQPTPIAQNEYQTSILESSKPSSDPEGKKSSESLPAEHQYDILCVHIETIKKSSSTETELTQIGCSVLNMNAKKRADDFFRAVKPSELDRLLDDYA